jgi:hypothetical protein
MAYFLENCACVLGSTTVIFFNLMVSIGLNTAYRKYNKDLKIPS